MYLISVTIYGVSLSLILFSFIWIFFVSFCFFIIITFNSIFTTSINVAQPSQNDRITVFEVGRDPWRSSGPMPLLKQGHLEQITQDHVQTAFEGLCGRRLHDLFGQPGRVLNHLNRKEVFPAEWIEPPML